ncbi:ribonucleoside-diphosphate reductase subunit alpha [Bacillus subtilis]
MSVKSAVEKWNSDYLRYNVLASEKDEMGRYQTEHDLTALKMIIEEAKQATMRFESKKQRMEFMIRNGFYKEDLLRGDITYSDIEGLYNTYKKHDRGDTAFISQLVFLSSNYAYKLLESEVEGLVEDWQLPPKRYDDKYILMEDKSDRAVAIALEVSGGKLDLAHDVVKGMAMRSYHPATPTYANAGVKGDGQLTSCFILKFKDSLQSVADMDSYTIHLSDMGGGIGFDATDVKAVGEKVGNIDNRSIGVLPLANRAEQALSIAVQGGIRKGNGVFFLDVFHPDIYALLDAKKENTDEKTRLSFLSVGVIMRDKFMELFEQGKDYYVFYPNSVYEEYGIRLSDIDMNKMYDELVANPRVRKERYNTGDFMNLCARVASESGYPYFMFRETVNESHVFKGAMVYSSNLCTEVLQRQDDGNGVQCTLASVNILETMKNKNIAETVRLVTRHLNGVLDRGDMSIVPDIEKARLRFRAIGMGAMNLHGYFANVGIPYESEYAIDFVRTYFMMMNYYSISTSVDLVDEYGVFDEFKDTTYADGTYFDKYLKTDYRPVTDRVKNLFKGVYIPTPEDWKTLKYVVQKRGMANAYRICIAPTGKISYLSGATQSVMPITQLVESSVTKDYKAFFPMPGLSQSNYFLYKNAYRIDDFKMLNLIATIQEHVDQGISTTLFITSEYTSSIWAERVLYAWKLGLKTLYYARPKKTVHSGFSGNGDDGIEVSNYEECESCT